MRQARRVASFYTLVESTGWHVNRIVGRMKAAGTLNGSKVGGCWGKQRNVGELGGSYRPIIWNSRSYR